VIDEFKLVEEKELAPLAELIQQFKARKESKENSDQQN
jgi:MOB kinase activator 1